jgi:hypothetical protein
MRQPNTDMCWKTWRKQNLKLDTRHRSDQWRSSDPKSWVLTMCPTKLYGSIVMSFRGSQEMIYQRKFKSLHGVKRLVKTKTWIPLERRTWEESKELDGGSEEGPWEILLLPILRSFLGWIFKSPWEKGRGERERRGVLHDFGRGWKLVNDIGERRRMVKDRFFLLWTHGLQSGATGQTGDGHRSDRWPPLVGPVIP